MTNNAADVKGFLKIVSKKYQNIKRGIDKNIENEFLEFSDSTGKRELLEKEVHVLSRALYYPTGDEIMKKRALVILAQTGTIGAFRQIEEYFKNPDKGLRQWSALALNHCLSHIANDQPNR